MGIKNACLLFNKSQNILLVSLAADIVFTHTHTHKVREIVGSSRPCIYKEWKANVTYFNISAHWSPSQEQFIWTWIASVELISTPIALLISSTHVSTFVKVIRKLSCIGAITVNFTEGVYLSVAISRWIYRKIFLARNLKCFTVFVLETTLQSYSTLFLLLFLL